MGGSSPSCFIFSADNKVLRDPENLDRAKVVAVADADGESQEKKLRYPKSVILIIATEFCERFSFYGMRGSFTEGVDAIN